LSNSLHCACITMKVSVICLSLLASVAAVGPEGELKKTEDVLNKPTQDGGRRIYSYDPNKIPRGTGKGRRVILLTEWKGHEQRAPSIEVTPKEVAEEETVLKEKDKVALDDSSVLPSTTTTGVLPSVKNSLSLRQRAKNVLLSRSFRRACGFIVGTSALAMVLLAAAMYVACDPTYAQDILTEAQICWLNENRVCIIGYLQSLSLPTSPEAILAYLKENAPEMPQIPTMPTYKSISGTASTYVGEPLGRASDAVMTNENVKALANSLGGYKNDVLVALGKTMMSVSPVYAAYLINAGAIPEVNLNNGDANEPGFGDDVNQNDLGGPQENEEDEVIEEENGQDREQHVQTDEHVEEKEVEVPSQENKDQGTTGDGNKQGEENTEQPKQVTDQQQGEDVQQRQEGDSNVNDQQQGSDGTEQDREQDTQEQQENPVTKED